ncbi:MAG TPA: hypothetical protein VFJ30_05735 [Phycisphaerae bacterium]|nr:hypothetical protein [Phycisphaerae bacterium]
MKQSPADKRITERMAPGVLCREGFLGADRRPLAEILDADRSAVVGLGVTHEQLADRLDEVLRKAVAALGTPVEIRPGLMAVFHEGMGRIPCPWGHGIFPKGEVELADERTGETLRFTPLSVHLIGAHGFYQGCGSCYRIDPESLVRIFGLSD